MDTNDDNDKKIDPEVEIDTDPGDDVVFEDNTEVTGADYKAKTDKLRAKIKELEKKNAELLDGWQRDKADFINARKRDEEQKMEFLKFSKADIIAELLAVLDSFESAFKNKEAWEKADKNWRMGVEYIHTQLMNIMTQNGLAVINPIGERYDHNRDEAVETVKVDDEKDNDKILDVVRVGYELHGKEIRAPKVRVGHYS
ncbi:MAG: nucleotide exchange factor GrpE [Candidatus Paceibacterota bacterium]|jgi:molecular chaperone GrpE